MSTDEPIVAVTTVPPGGSETFVLALDDDGEDPLPWPPEIMGAAVKLGRSDTFDLALDDNGKDPLV